MFLVNSHYKDQAVPSITMHKRTFSSHQEEKQKYQQISGTKKKKISLEFFKVRLYSTMIIVNKPEIFSISLLINFLF